MRLTHGFVVLPPEIAKQKSGTAADILHFVGYEGQPTEHDLKALQEELATDESLGLKDVEFVIIPASTDVLNFYQAMIDEEGIEE
jgi:hypothetical protein